MKIRVEGYRSVALKVGVESFENLEFGPHMEIEDQTYISSSPASSHHPCAIVSLLHITALLKRKPSKLNHTSHALRL